MAAITAPAQEKQTSWKVAVLFFFLGWIFIYADRMILNPVQVLIRTDFNLTNAEVGLISSLFFMTYTLLQVPSGILGDKLGKAKVIAFGITLGLVASSYIAFDMNGGRRLPFYIFAVPTILVGLGILIFVKEPKREAQSASAPKAKFTDLLKNRNLLLTYLLVFCSLYGFFVMCTWLPVYLEEVRGIARSDTGFVSSLVA